MSTYKSSPIKPQHVKRLNTPEAVFDLPVHEVNKTNSEVTRHDEETREGTFSSWRGFDKKRYTSKNMGEEVKREIAEGWPEGCALISQARERVLNVAMNAPASRRLRMSHGHVTGFNPHIPTVMKGLPTAFSQWERKPKIQAVRLLCELTASAGIGADNLVWRGAACLVISDLLQEAGYAVEIWAVNTVCSGANYEPTCTAALVKGAESAPIPDLLASVLVSPRYYRTGMLCSTKTFDLSVPCGYGKCLELNPAHLAGTELEDLKEGIYVGGCFDIDSAVKKINEVTERINNGSQENAS